MRLKSIKLTGFKSFVDQTTATFPSNLCAVVGPNGCGKSNIIDAVRWVMGESSAKNLRGEALTDVIFSGSDNRKPLGQCSIELIFDNSDHTITGEYAAYNEISIKRVVTREAISTYFLNGTKCRRRDITDIFLGTGLGPRSYSIIEQGMISKLIEAKPDELRVYVEEAAGISKYKERRRDTENRIRRTRENMERLTDIREELERQLDRLKRQAAAAEKYEEYKKEERRTKAQLQGLRYQRLHAEASQREQNIRDLEVKAEACVADKVSLDTELEKMRTAEADQKDKVDEVQKRFYSAGGEVTRIEQSIKHAEERATQLQLDLEQTEKSVEESEHHMVQDQEKIDRWQDELVEIDPELSRFTEQAEKSSTILQKAEEAMANWQQEWDQFNEAAAEPRQQAEVQQARLQTLEQVLKRLEERMTRLKEEQDNLAKQDDPETVRQLTELRDQVSAMDSDIEARQSDIDSMGERISGLKGDIQKLSDSQDADKAEMQKMAGRHASLEALQQSALGSEAGVNRWLENRQLKDKPRLADGLKVSPGWEKAVEMVLGNYLQAVCVDSLDNLSSALGDLEQGELLLVDSASASPAQADKGNPLANYIEQGQAGSMVGGVYAVDGLQEALKLRKSLSASESVVTRDGVWLGSNWLRVVRDKDPQAGILQRKQELVELDANLTEINDRIADQQKKLVDSRAELEELEASREGVRGEMSVLIQEHGELTSNLSAEEARIEQMERRRKNIDAEIAEAKEQQQHEDEAQKESRRLLEEAIDGMERDSLRKEELMQQRDALRKELDEARQTARHDRDKAHELAMRHQSVQTQLESMRESIERLKVQTERLVERRESLKSNLAENKDPVGDLKKELEVKLEEKLGVEQEFTAVRQEQQALEHSMREVEQKRSTVEQEINAVRERLNNEKLTVQESQVRRKTIVEQLQEMNREIDDVIESLPEEATEEQWEQDLEAWDRRIKRLGAINLAAIDEYHSQSERKTYLDAQHEDLTGALESLEGAIRKIDRETRTRFKETFDARARKTAPFTCCLAVRRP
jgi:chromosome segregation protein